jgi:hypothetical protein
LVITDMTGRQVATLIKPKEHKVGTYEHTWRVPASVAAGTYIATFYSGATVLQSVKVVRQTR